MTEQKAKSIARYLRQTVPPAKIENLYMLKLRADACKEKRRRLILRYQHGGIFAPWNKDAPGEILLACCGYINPTEYVSCMVAHTHQKLSVVNVERKNALDLVNLAYRAIRRIDVSCILPPSMPPKEIASDIA